MFYVSRLYDPVLGRFAQADSIVPGGAQGLDRYGYVNDNPVRYTDPSGHCPTCLIGAGIGALAGGLAYGAYAAYTDNFNGWHLAAAIGGGAVAGALIGTGVGIVAGMTAAEATAVATTGASIACADADCTNEAASLVEMGVEALGTLESQG